MPEFLDQPKWLHQPMSQESPNSVPDDGFNAMGKEVPSYRRQAAYDHCKAMGMTDPEYITACVGGMAEALERDKPYEAMEAGMRHLDLTGTYRLMAVLLCESKPKIRVPHN